MHKSRPVKTALQAAIVILATAIIAGMIVFIPVAFPRVAAESREQVVVVRVEGTITSGQLAYLQRQLAGAEKIGAQLFLIEMDTPGGLVDATLKINTALLNTPLPVAVLVTPAGAIAASAGSFIVLAADIAAMAPGTTIGAAQPVALTPGGAADAGEKTTRFLAQHLRTLAREHGRPTDIAGRFVTENLSLSSREALEEGVIDYLAADRAELFRLIDGRTVKKKGQTRFLNMAGAVVIEAEMNLQERFQAWLSDPQIAFILLMLGVLGLYFGFSTPGTFVPEVIGGILVVMGIYGIGLFDADTTGIILLLLGIGLIVTEIFTAGFGIFGIGGALSLLAGAILLPREPLMGTDWYGAFRITAIGAAVAVAVISLLVIQRIVRSRRHRPKGHTFLGTPRRGRVLTAIPARGQGVIRAHGELWQARSAGETAIAVETEVEVVRADSLILYVRPVQENENERDGG